MQAMRPATKLNPADIAVRDYLATISCRYDVLSLSRDSGQGSVPIVRDGWECYAWYYTFKRYERGAWREFSGNYFTGTALKGRPTAASILHSLILDSSASGQSFPDWCADFGSDSDSIKAFDTYRACLDIAENLRKLFTTEQRQHLATLLQDY